ncbi:MULTISPECIES: biliverdin-producing heme oxygenase [unclassified Leucobacter]|uniref:biliverdin-producing heme oxygenase n=1 Tax=unclassified Leucobacter TaxID=2621730 RepID=UPI000A596C07|nr:biliverdin-producing heme oxygenase [Leucobacter sp. Ag1]
MSDFDETVISGVIGHMNGDHTDDNLLIARAFGYPDATASTMTGLTGEHGCWTVVDPAGEHELCVPWPAGRITERPQIRREVVLLYREACKRLGVEPRAEHEAPQHLPGQGNAAHPHGSEHAAHGGAHPHGGHGHGHGEAAHAGSNPHAAPAQEGPVAFSVEIRSGSWSDHSDSEGAGFMEGIMRGRGTREDYVALAVQHYFMYEALEESAAKFEQDARFAGFHSDDLERMAALEEDLEFLVGDDWRERIEPTPATAAYAARIREIADEGWLPGLVAHHYTRYLGDLSGGQMIARRVGKQFGFEHAGISFYDFSSLGDLAEFKDRYRAELDALGETLDQAERDRVLAEVRTAYRFNTDVFGDLARAKAAN